ncbi:stage II sporulation protein E [Inediibacterium massiliense]|uniref:stage II sporulation protein E n=1 Tax=Inediibacterium massiliense TaxID=1658111 RepID=UPI0006B62E3B|nr:stage II sporulation protein E [Inediibacterium massiliense]
MAERTSIIPYKREYGGQARGIFKDRKKQESFHLSKNMGVLLLIAFLLGRATILESLAPFGIALYITLVVKDKRYTYLGLFILFGIFTAGDGISVAKYFIAIALSFMIFSYIREKRELKTFILALCAGGTMFVSGLIFMMATEFYMYDLFMTGFESVVVFVFVYILAYAVPIIVQRRNRKILSNEELVCIAILMAIVVSGFSNISLGGCSLKNIFGMLLTLVFAYKGGPSIGASVGITIGIITSMSTIGAPFMIGIYGFCGLLAGIFKDLGRIGSGVGIILGNAILTFYTNGSTEVLIQIQEIIVALGFFMITPKSIMKYMDKFVGTNGIQGDRTYSERIQRIVSEKLQAYSNAFSELAVTYGNIAETKQVLDQGDMANMVDDIVEKLCKNCGMCRSCWQNNFYGTYNDVLDVVTYLETYGSIKESQIPNTLRKRCIKLDTLMEVIYGRFEICKVHYEWQRRLFEGRQLVAEQFKGVSNIIHDLSKEINTKIEFKIDIEDALYAAFDKEEISVDKITIMEREDEKFEIEIQKRACFDRNRCEEEIIPIVSKVIGREVVKKDNHCRCDEDTGKCTFTLVEAKKYKVLTGVARVSKDDRGICGDNYSFIDLEDGKYMMALSDGMGSGEKAAKESQATISVLEHLMEAGFEKDIAIKTINSILVLKSSEEIFSTMDLSILDLYTGKIEFVKIGAASSFVKRASGKVEVIRSTSLPIGILNNIDIESFGQELEDGDFIIMMSDGVADADKNMEDGWVVEAIKGINSKNPEKIADKLLDMAIQKYGNKIEDDMTVMVSKIWKV